MQGERERGVNRHTNTHTHAQGFSRTCGACTRTAAAAAAALAAASTTTTGAPQVNF